MNPATDILRTMNQGPVSLASLTATTNAAATTSSAAGSVQSSFTSVMQQHAATGTTGDRSDDAAAAREAQAEKSAGDLISNALILPMLKQLRRSPWGENTPFSPGIGEKTFGPQFDIQISDRIAHSPRLGIEKALAQRLIKRGHPDAPSNAQSAPANATQPGSTLNVRG